MWVEHSKTQPIGISLVDSFASFFTDKTKYPTSVCLSLVTSLHHRYTHPLHLLISPFLHLLLNLKSSIFCLTVLTSKLILILFPLGFSSNVYLFLSLQPLTSSTSLSPLVSFTPFWKKIVISPLLKKSSLDKDELSNYRPISILSVLSKIIERVVKSRLMDHLTTNYLTLTSLPTANITPFVKNVTKPLIILSYALLWCSPRLCSRPSTFHHVNYPSQYTDLFRLTTTFMQIRYDTIRYGRLTCAQKADEMASLI